MCSENYANAACVMLYNAVKTGTEIILASHWLYINKVYGSTFQNNAECCTINFGYYFIFLEIFIVQYEF